MERIHTVGRRKTAVARAHLAPGNGAILVNGKDYKEYFKTLKHQNVVEEAFKVTETLGNYDTKINLDGGGVSGQADAAKLAIARALVQLDTAFKEVLKKNGFLKRDPRMVERKKPGKAKARKNFQFRKR
jgi:small subunit ribosomal protein S9